MNFHTPITSFRPAPPEIEAAPGLVWRLRRGRWEARWRPNARFVRGGYPSAVTKLWRGRESDLTDFDRVVIADQCRMLQEDMLAWSKIKDPLAPSQFDGTIRSLINFYRTHPISRYRKVRCHTRENYDSQLARIDADHGAVKLSAIKSLQLMEWHVAWCQRGIPMAHGLMGMLRSILGFGVLVFEDPDCIRLKVILHEMKFPMADSRPERLTAHQANLIRAKAHELGWHSIAVAQAFQFECTLRQRDVIGEWVPRAEEGESEVVDQAHDEKWLRGLRWSEIDPDMRLSHITSKRQKRIEVDLRHAPMVLEELARLPSIPATGPIVICERTGLPWTDHSFRREWRKIATACGIPVEVYNMDTRAGSISEMTDAGADLEHVRHAAAHSNISMTQRYSRGSVEKIAAVMKKRVEYRNATALPGNLQWVS